MRKTKASGKIGRKINRVCQCIELANDLEIQEIMRAVERRYAQMYPQWDVIYMAVRKEPTQRQADLQGILSMLKKEETDSLAWRESEISCFGVIQTFKECIVAAVIELAQFNENADANIQFTGLVFGIGGPTNVAAPSLQFGAQFLLGQSAFISQLAQVVAHISVPSDFLLHRIPPAIFFDQYWLQSPLFYGILTWKIDRDTGQNA